MKLRLLIISRVAGKREKVSVRGRDRLRYDIRAAVLTPGYEIARFRGTLSERTCTRAHVHVNGRVCCAYLSVYYKETRAWNTHPSKSHGVAPWKLTAGNTKGRLTSERYNHRILFQWMRNIYDYWMSIYCSLMNKLMKRENFYFWCDNIHWADEI